MKFDYSINPWLFNDIPFNDCGGLAGFVYQIDDLDNGMKYLGKKFFFSKRKPKGKTRRVTMESDWKFYFGSNTTIKDLIKIHGIERFRRRILSLHSLERDVNYMEVKMQYVMDVLNETFPDGLPVWYNGNISGKHYFHLVNGIDTRTTYCQSSLFLQKDILASKERKFLGT